jgi:hypothetical protein
MRQADLRTNQHFTLKQKPIHPHGGRARLALLG